MAKSTLIRKNYCFLVLLLVIDVCLLRGCTFNQESSALSRQKLNGDETFLIEHLHPVEDDPVQSKRKLQNAAHCQILNGTTLHPTKQSICSAYAAIRDNFESSIIGIADLLNKSSIYGAAVRVAFHDAAEVNIQLSDDFLGPDGCLSDSSDNAGLVELNSKVTTVMEPIWAKQCNKISRADFWVLFAKLVIEAADPTGTILIDFQFGRVDALSCNAGASGRLPFPQKGLSELERVFVNQMGLTLDDAGCESISSLLMHFLSS